MMSLNEKAFTGQRTLVSWHQRRLIYGNHTGLWSKHFFLHIWYGNRKYFELDFLIGERHLNINKKLKDLFHRRSGRLCADLMRLSEDRPAIDTFRGEGFLCHSFKKESVVKKGAGDCFAVCFTDACLPHGRPPCVANSFNNVIEDNGRFFFG